MDQPTATLLASLIAAAGSTTVGVVAVTAAARQNRRTLRQQRQMAADDRLGDRRVDLYVELLELTLHTGGTPVDDNLTENLQKVAARVHAFASDEVMGTFDQMLFESRRPMRDEDERYVRGERLGIQLDNLLSSVRGELQPDSVPYVPPAPQKRVGRLARLLSRRRRRKALS